jgi:hypothetical protein
VIWGSLKASCAEIPASWGNWGNPHVNSSDRRESRDGSSTVQWLVRL